MSTEIDICNLALSNLGDRAKVTSLNPLFDKSVQAEHCARFYPLARDAVLEAYPWSFATKRATLTEVSNALVSDYAWAYALPTDALRPLQAVYPGIAAVDFGDGTVGGSSFSYTVESSAAGDMVLYTNLRTAVLRYIARVTDATKFPPLFVIAVARLLASWLAGPLIKGETGVKLSRSMAEWYVKIDLPQAIAAEAKKGRTDLRYYRPNWIAARDGAPRLPPEVTIGALSPWTPGGGIVVPPAPPAPSPSPTPAPSPAPAFGPIPFGSYADGPYLYGIKPSATVFSKAAAEANLIAQYKAMYDAHFKPSMSALAGGMGPCMNPSAAADQQHIVSEGIGYWMLIAVVMHGIDMGSNGGTVRKTPREQFDGCVTTAMSHPALGWLVTYPGDPRSDSLAHLMAYMIKADGSSMPIDYQYNAVDGDLDIALAFFMADRQWPEGHPVYGSYRTLGIQRVNAMKAWVFTSEGTPNGLAQPAGSHGYPSDPAFMCARTSDFMFNHFRNFARVTQDPFWMGQTPLAQGKGNVWERCLWLSEFITTYSGPPVLSPSGLLPDFIEGVGGPWNPIPFGPLPPQQSPSYPVPFLPLNKLGHGDPGLIVQMVDNPPYNNYTRWPSPADTARGLTPNGTGAYVGQIMFDPAISSTPQYEGSEDGYYTRARNWDSNACRDSWRMYTEVAMTGNSRVKAALDKFNNFFKGIMTAGGGNDATLIQDSYNLDGTVSQFATTGELSEVLGCVMAGMASDPIYQPQLDKLWRWNTGLDTGRNDSGYYAGTLQFLSKLVVAGLWWEPRPGASLPASGSIPPAPPPPPPPAPAPAGADAAITAGLAAASGGFWFDTDAFTRFLQDYSAGTPSTAWDQPIGVWVDRSSFGNSINIVSALEQGVTVTVSSTVHGAHLYRPIEIGNTGRATTFYYAACLRSDNYYGTLFSCLIGNDGWELRHTADNAGTAGTGDLILTIGTGTGLVNIPLQSGAAAYNTIPDIFLLEAWDDGTSAGLRFNKGTPATNACGPASAGASTMTIGGFNFDPYGSTQDLITADWFCAVLMKNHCPTLANRNSIATRVAARGGLVL